jgi:glycosyltransferase involved in cell wall biosynthesis
MDRIPLTVIIPTRNEEKNIEGVLKSVDGWASQVIVVDSQSTDSTLEIVGRYDVEVLQFHYAGGWPKKRQWVLDNHRIRNEWILLLDADEIPSPQIKSEIEQAIQSDRFDGYWVPFKLEFLGKPLSFGNSVIYKLFLFRNGRGRYERILSDQIKEMSDIEVHEHVVVDGRVGRLVNPVIHRNHNSLFRYIQKHNEYSTWEAHTLVEGSNEDIKPDIFGDRIQRNRWLKRFVMLLPLSSQLYFVYLYVFRLSFMDGYRGYVFCKLKSIQWTHIKFKVFEIRNKKYQG